LIPTAVIALALAVVGAPPSTRDRYAADIAAASPDVATGLALVATGWEESRFEARIERCDCRSWECDGGAAHGLFQLHAHWFAGHTAAEVCGSSGLSAALAARALGHLRQVSGTFEGAFARYVGARSTDPRIRRRVDLFHRLLESANGA
jgi:hypothetical protein